ncbi:MAG: DUF4416 family protein [Candidatus Omnitrophica bacterium]|nr:DUF4416 family protein [Candidatus Omnitrophota bacterium]
MGQIRKSASVKLIIGFIYKEEIIAQRVLRRLTRRFGPIDFESQVFSFAHTDYYAKEFGAGLKRRFFSFKKLIHPHILPKVKVITNIIETRYAVSLRAAFKRRINIDPGYLDLAKLVLASTKNYSHRIYLDKGIFAEVTLFYQENSYRAWEWTYPDYKLPEAILFFNHLRGIYAAQIQNR